MITLIFCNNKNYFSNPYKSKLWNYFITNQKSEFESYLTIYHPKTIIVSERISEEIPFAISTIRKYYLHFPAVHIFSDSSILEYILDNENNTKIFKPERIPEELDNLINGFLIRYGLEPHLKGFTYIKRCLYEALINEAVFTNAKKSVYTSIAGMYCTGVTSVERNINFSVSKAYSKSPLLRELFGSSYKTPSNLLFLKKMFFVMKTNIKK